MPRLPAGFHRQSGSGAAGTFRPRRIQVTPPLHYTRQIEAELHAGASAVLSPHAQVGPLFRWQAQVGPQALERWAVDLVQVQFPTQYGASPLVAQQIQAQISGTTTSPPPPNVAQAWLMAGGVLVHLLAQTTQGGNDTMDVSSPALSAGEAIAVVWYGLLGQGVPWCAVRGTRYALVQM